ncbi:uncharacterized protein Rcd6 [Anabrus simplex]|uniref:uncharacterized protein Rcd6 n=1 Tax=Anabrus simplex TaxID=316456 RepID=UPI0035A296A3
MALLESCLCCSLLVASAIAGVYAVVAYVVAFTIELWWILEAKATLPAPAYLLCAGYFFIFIFSALLLHGLTVKRTLYLLGWLFVITIFSFPEAGLVLFMSLHFWEIKSLYGRMELAYWICRVLCNIAGVVCVQSLYSTWKEEKLVMRRLQDLNMTPVIANPALSRRNSIGNNSMKNGSAGGGYQNAGFINSTARLSIVNTAKVPPMGKLRRSASSASQLDLRSQPMFGGSLPANNFPDHIPQLTPLNNLQYAYFSLPDGAATGSEFNASTFDGMMAASVGSNSSRLINSGRKNMLGITINRTQSLMDLRSGVATEDLWNSEYPLHRISVDCVDYMPAAMTQSLDRRVLRLSGRLRRASSVDELSYYGRRSSSVIEGTTAYRDNLGRIIFHPPPDYYMYRRTRSNAHNSRRSLAESDDMQKIRDVAL